MIQALTKLCKSVNPWKHVSEIQSLKESYNRQSQYWFWYREWVTGGTIRVGECGKARGLCVLG